MAEKMCPIMNLIAMLMATMAGEGASDIKAAAYCLKEDCQWWVTVNESDERIDYSYSDCAIIIAAMRGK